MRGRVASALGWLGFTGRDGIIVFGIRLAAAYILTLALVGVLGYHLIDRTLYQAEVRSNSAAQRVDARGLEAIGSHATGQAAALREARDFMAAFGRRPGTLEVTLIDQRGIVAASNQTGRIGATDLDARVIGALEGRTYAGHEQAPGTDHRNFEFATAVTFRGEPYALETTLDHRVFDTQLSGSRTALWVAGLIALFGGGALFHLVGGRALIRSHRYALRRTTLDGLTDLPNRRAFEEELSQAVNVANRHADPLALAVVDIDDFKLVNDRLGHAQGDAILCEMAAFLRDGRAGDRAYRIGGDRFAAVLPRTAEDGVHAFARRLVNGLAGAGISASVGIATLRFGDSAEMLEDQASAALLEARRVGRNQVAFFDDLADRIVVTSPAKKEAVRHLIATRDMTAAYQPIWDLQSGTLLGVEALCRFDDSYGLSGPAEAFDVAEQLGLVHELDEACIAAALRSVREIPEGAFLFLNICPQTLDRDEGCDEWLCRALREASWPATRTVIEVTERFGGRAPSVLSCLSQLRAHGFGIALDDVGTGNSGLEMLRTLGADYVKIDGGVVKAALVETNARAVLMAMATYARQTGAYVIAEGIEGDETLALLRCIEELEDGHSLLIQGGQGDGLGSPHPALAATPPDSVLAFARLAAPARLG